MFSFNLVNLLVIFHVAVCVFGQADDAEFIPPSIPKGGSGPPPSDGDIFIIRRTQPPIDLNFEDIFRNIFHSSFPRSNGDGPALFPGSSPLFPSDSSPFPSDSSPFPNHPSLFHDYSFDFPFQFPNIADILPSTDDFPGFDPSSLHNSTYDIQVVNDTKIVTNRTVISGTDEDGNAFVQEFKFVTYIPVNGTMKGDNSTVTDAGADAEADEDVAEFGIN